MGGARKYGTEVDGVIKHDRVVDGAIKQYSCDDATKHGAVMDGGRNPGTTVNGVIKHGAGLVVAEILVRK